MNQHTHIVVIVGGGAGGLELAAKLGRKYGKTPAQVILRWHTQMGFAVIPGSRNVQHIRDNIDIFDFTLTDEELAAIAKVDNGQRYYQASEEALAGYLAFAPDFNEQE